MLRPVDRRGLVLRLDAQDGALRAAEDRVAVDLRDADDGAGRKPRRRRERVALRARGERLLRGVDDVVGDRGDVGLPIDAALAVGGPDDLAPLAIDDEEGAAHLAERAQRGGLARELVVGELRADAGDDERAERLELLRRPRA